MNTLDTLTTIEKNIQAGWSDKAIYYALRMNDLKSLIEPIIEYGYMGIFEWLLEKLPSVFSEDTRVNYTSIMIRLDLVDMLRRFMEFDNGEVFNGADKRYMILQAINHNSIGCLKLLIDSGAILERTPGTFNQYDLLATAAQRNQKKSFEVLLAAWPVYNATGEEPVRLVKLQKKLRNYLTFDAAEWYVYRIEEWMREKIGGKNADEVIMKYRLSLWGA